MCITDSQVLEGSKRRRRNKSDLDPDEARGRDGRETETEGPGVGSRGESGHVSPLDDGNATHGTASGANMAASLRNRASADPRRQSKVKQPSREDKLIKDKLITIPDWASSGDRTWLLRKVAAFYPVPSTFTRIITTITTTTVAIATTQQIAKQESKEWWCAEP